MITVTRTTCGRVRQGAGPFKDRKRAGGGQEHEHLGIVCIPTMKITIEAIASRPPRFVMSNCKSGCVVWQGEVVFTCMRGWLRFQPLSSLAIINTDVGAVMCDRQQNRVTQWALSPAGPATPCGHPMWPPRHQVSGSCAPPSQIRPQLSVPQQLLWW